MTHRERWIAASMAFAVLATAGVGAIVLVNSGPLPTRAQNPPATSTPLPSSSFTPPAAVTTVPTTEVLPPPALLAQTTKKRPKKPKKTTSRRPATTQQQPPPEVTPTTGRPDPPVITIDPPFKPPISRPIVDPGPGPDGQ